MCISSKMYACCVLGCPNSHSSGGKLKFFRLPTEYRPFQANRRRLWLKVLRQVNGSAEELEENARICGAHFISGNAQYCSFFLLVDFFARLSPEKSRRMFTERACVCRTSVHGSRQSRLCAFSVCKCEEQPAPQVSKQKAREIPLLHFATFLA